MSSTISESKENTAISDKKNPYNDNETTTDANPDAAIAGSSTDASPPAYANDPPAYTDNVIVNVRVRKSDLNYDPNAAPLPQQTQPESGPSFLKKLGKSLKSPASSHKDEEVIMMSKREYERYWAKGEDGRFLPGIEEPPEGRKKWVQRQKVKTAGWLRNDAAKGGYVGAGGFNSGGVTAKSEEEDDDDDEGEGEGKRSHVID